MKKITVSGRVVDKAGIPLPGVSVVIKGTTLGVPTDIDGKFSLSFAEQSNVVFVFSFVGMKSRRFR